MASILSPEPEQVVTVGEASLLLGVSRRTIHNWLERNTLKFWRTPGGHVRIARASVNDLLEDRQRQLDRQDQSTHCCVLVVDDDPTIVDYYVSSVEHWGLPVQLETAENGFQGLIQLARKRPDLILTDLRMQGMDGFELIRHLQSRDDFQALRMVVVTELSQETIQERGGLPEGILKLDKPPPMDRIRAIIEEILTSQKSGKCS
ncbi:MAG: response regulator [Magnetococcales bacterium]|nr:response regulator [Magnetococcales bacterium]